MDELEKSAYRFMNQPWNEREKLEQILQHDIIQAIEDGFIFCDVSHELVDKDNTIEYNPKIRMAINISHIETIEFLTN